MNWDDFTVWSMFFTPVYMRVIGQFFYRIIWFIDGSTSRRIHLFWCNFGPLSSSSFCKKRHITCIHFNRKWNSQSHMIIFSIIFNMNTKHSNNLLLMFLKIQIKWYALMSSLKVFLCVCVKIQCETLHFSYQVFTNKSGWTKNSIIIDLIETTRDQSFHFNVWSSTVSSWIGFGNYLTKICGKFLIIFNRFWIVNYEQQVENYVK